jgi:hypothetical protein
MSAYVTFSPQGPFPVNQGPHTGNAFGMGQLDLGAAARLLASQTVGTVVDEITFRSQLTPPVTIRRPFAAGTPGTASGPSPAEVQGGNPITRQILALARPAMYIKTPGGITIPFEPLGEPTEAYWAWALAGTAAVFGLGAWAGMRYRANRRVGT